MHDLQIVLLVPAFNVFPQLLLKLSDQMGWKIWQNKGIKFFNFAILIQLFYIIATTTLSLLLPLAFLVLAKLSSANYVFSITHHPQTSSSSLFFSIFLCINTSLLIVLLAIITLSALIHGLTGRISFIREYPSPNFQRTLLFAWILLFTFQLCVGLGIEPSIAIGFDGFGLVELYRRSPVSQVIFFIGLHEAMLHWSRMVVQPVVNDTIFGRVRGERWVEKAVLAASFGGLWWWTLRQGMDALVSVVEAKVKNGLGIWVVDFAGWWLYYAVVTIGMIRLIKRLLWLIILMFCRNLEEDISDQAYSDEDRV